jgi:uncharacterized protein (DUF1778 family)
LVNLAKIHKLKTEPANPREFDGLVGSALDRATDAKNPGLTLASRFTLAYDVFHAQAAALVIQAHENIRLSQAEQIAFVTALLNPAAPNEQLSKAAANYRQQKDV